MKPLHGKPFEVICVSSVDSHAISNVNHQCAAAWVANQASTEWLKVGEQSGEQKLPHESRLTRFRASGPDCKPLT
jgi:hypothetical protein